MRIQAYRRTAPFDVNLAPRGSLTEQIVKFYLLENTPYVVADVDNQRHVDMLLNVPEAYREYSEDRADVRPSINPEANRASLNAESIRAAELRAAEQRQQIKTAEENARRIAAEEGTLIGSNVQPTTISLTGSRTVPLGDVVVAAHRASGLSREEWNELQGDEREAFISKMVTQMEDEAEQAEEGEREALRLKMEQEEREAADIAKKARAEQEAAEAAIAAAKFTLIAADGSTIDLKGMGDTKLREFAKTYSVDLPPGIKGDAIRQVIVDKLAPTGSDEQAANDLNEKNANDATKA